MTPTNPVKQPRITRTEDPIGYVSGWTPMENPDCEGTGKKTKKANAAEASAYSLTGRPALPACHLSSHPNATSLTERGRAVMPTLAPSAAAKTISSVRRRHCIAALRLQSFANEFTFAVPKIFQTFPPLSAYRMQMTGKRLRVNVCVGPHILNSF